jgi:hypothetical protein
MWATRCSGKHTERKEKQGENKRLQEKVSAAMAGALRKLWLAQVLLCIGECRGREAVSSDVCSDF